MASRASSPHIVALVVAATQFMQNLDTAIVNTSLPQMARSFGVGPVDLSVGVTAYVLASAAFVPISGWAAARFGGRPVFAFAVIVFTLASIGCGAAQTLWQFIAARVAQGFGGALMVPVGQAIVLRHTERRDLIRSMALITWPSLLAPVIGPVLGGWITTYSSWRWNFLMNAPLGVVATALILIVIPRDAGAAPRRFDARGFVLCSLALVCLLEGLELFANTAFHRLSATLVVVGAVSGLAAVRHLRRADQPLLRLSALKEKTYAMSAVDAGFVLRSIINATPFLLPLMFQVAWGRTPAEAGLLLLFYFLGNIGIKPATTPLLRHFGFRNVLIWNGTTVGVSLFVCAALSPDLPLPALAVILVLCGAARSLQFTAQNTMMYSDVAAPDKGSAATLSSMLQQVSIAVGVASSAFLVQMSRAYHDRAVSGLWDFRFALILLGAAGVLAALRFRTLPHDAAAEVSGHRAVLKNSSA